MSLTFLAFKLTLLSHHSPWCLRCWQFPVSYGSHHQIPELPPPVWGSGHTPGQYPVMNNNNKILNIANSTVTAALTATLAPVWSWSSDEMRKQLACKTSKAVCATHYLQPIPLLLVTNRTIPKFRDRRQNQGSICLLYTSDAADD